MADLSTLRSRVRTVVDDSPGSLITDTNIDAWINEAYLDLSSRLGLLHGEYSASMGAAGTSVANGTIDLPTDFVTATSLRIGTDDVQWADDELFWANQDETSDPSRTLGRVFNEKIELYPKPTTGTAFILRYVKKPTALSSAGDTPSIAEELHVKLVNYARAHAKYKEGDFGAGDRYMTMYETDLPMVSLRSRILPSPLEVVPERGYFDSSSYLGWDA